MESMEVITAFTIENIIFFLFLILFLCIGIGIFLLPIIVANKKNIKGDEYATIKILTWCGLLCGLTWIIALFLSFYYKRRF